MAFDPQKKAEVVKGSSLPEVKPVDAVTVPAAKRAPCDYDVQVQTTAKPHSHLNGMLDVLGLPLIMRSGFKEAKGGWQSKTGEFLSFDEIQAEIDARLREVDLPLATLEHWMDSVQQSAEQYQAFFRLPISERVAQIRELNR